MSAEASSTSLGGAQGDPSDQAGVVERVLMLHNRYRSGMPSGENVTVDIEVQALRAAGYDVTLLQTDSDDLVGGERAWGQRLQAAPRAVWNRDVVGRLERLLDTLRPDIVHVQNDFPQLGPAVHFALARRQVPYIQSIHSYRFGCVDASFFRDGAPCHDCLGKRVALSGIRHRCGGGLPRSSYVAAWMAANTRGQRRGAPLFVANSEHVQRLLVAHGLPAELVTFRHIVAGPAPARVVPAAARRGVVAAGRLDLAKGFDTLVEAWVRNAPAGHSLTIAGDGPQRVALEALASGRDDVRFVGNLPPGDVLELIARARLVVVPSRWEEPFGRVALEALQHGTPALVSEAGGLSEIVGPETPDLVVPPGDVDALGTRLDAVHPAPEQLAASTEERFGRAAFLARTRVIYRRSTQRRRT